MKAGLACLAAVAAALALSACESTQDRAAAERAKNAHVLENRHGLRITKRDPFVKILRKTILHDANGTAVVVELVNESRRAQAQVPIGIRLDDARGRKVFANDAPGLEPALVSIPLLPSHKDSFWVHNQIIAAGTPRKLAVAVGAPAPTAVPAAPPHITLSSIKLDHDSSGAFVTGLVHNRSKVVQKRLTIFCAASRGRRIVAAGRAVVDRLAPAPTPKPVHFSVYFIGNPAGASLRFSVPPVQLR